MAEGGSLRTYLGIAPGVGKTFAMLTEGRRRAESGEHVVVGWIESHGRLETSGQLGDLEVIAPRTVAYRGTVFADFDAPAAIASGADVVLVDELAHATADRSRQRWQDVADVLRAGLDVVTRLSSPTVRCRHGCTGSSPPRQLKRYETLDRCLGGGSTCSATRWSSWSWSWRWRLSAVSTLPCSRRSPPHCCP